LIASFYSESMTLKKQIVNEVTKNAFSKKSIEVLFEKFDLHILQINIDKVNKGKIIVFAGK